jgi:hypothetical protein
MFKKLLAGLTTLVLSLGMVALTAAPASAHHGNLGASFACTTDSKGTITWTVQNSEYDKTARVWSSNKAGLPVGTDLGPSETKTFTEPFNGTGSSELKVTLRWYDGSGNPDHSSNWGNEWSGSKTISIKSSDYNNCKPTEVTPTSPTFASAQCTGPGTYGQASYTIPSTTGVRYEVRFHSYGNSGWQDAPTGTYPVAANAYVEVRAIALDGYKLKNYSNPWKKQFTAPANCTVDVTPTSPTFTSAQCTGPGTYGQASYTIPSTTGVRYEVRFQSNGNSGWQDAPTGTYPVAANAYVEVRAFALDGYKLKNYPGTWKKQFTKPDCTVEVKPTSPTFTSAQCDAAGEFGPASYTIPSTTGVRYEVRFHSNGNSGWQDAPTGTYPVAANAYVEVRAIALSGYELKSYSGAWKKQFVKGDCKVTPTTPTFTSAVCTGPGQNGDASYTIPSSVGVRYEVRFHSYGNSGWQNAPTGTYPVAANSYVEVRAIALNGFELKNYPGTWKKQFTKPDCIVEVNPPKPTSTDAVCTAEGQTGGAGFTIPEVTGVKYQRQTGPSTWEDLATGFHPTAEGETVWIRAVALSGYDLKHSDSTYKWKFVFQDVDESKCVVPADATKTPPVCSGPGQWTPGTYTIPSDTGIQYQVKQGDAWVDIETGTYDVNTFPTTVQIRALAKDGYTLVGGPYEWTFTFADPGDCIEEVEVVGDPVFVNAVCAEETTGVTPGHYFIPVTANVDYEVSVNGADPVPAIEGVEVPTNPNDHVVITAKAAAGYLLVGDDEWSHTFENPGECLDEAPTGAVTKVDQQCELIDDLSTAGKFGSVLRTLSASYTSGYIHIPNTPNVKYYLAPDMVNPLAPGDHDVEPGTYFVHAVADPGYKLVGQSVWELEVVESHDCDQLEEHPVVTPVVTFVQTTCSVAGSYTLGVEEDGLEDGVIWTVTPAGLPTTIGKHNVTTPGKVTITATPAEGYGFPEIEGEEVPVLAWEYTFTGLPEDCLPTLALTGGNPGIATGAVGFATLLTLGGALLVARSRREQFTAE